MKKKILLFLLVFVFCMNSVYATNAKVKEASKGVVRILVKDRNGNTYQGTGFAVGKSGKATTAFVTFSNLVENAESVKIILDYIGAGNSSLDATVLTVRNAPDLAILTIANSTEKFKPLPLSKDGKIQKADAVYHLGFMDSSENVKEFDRVSSTASDVVVKSALVGVADSILGGAAVFQTDAEQKYGLLGGPTINAKGEVVGITTYNPTSSEILSYHVQTLTRILDEQGIPYSSGFEFSFLPIIVILFAIIVGLLLLLSKKSKPVRRTPPSRDLREEKTVAMHSASTTSSFSSVSSNSPKIVGVSGYFTSQEFMIKDKLVIGRDPRRVQVTFPDKTQGVSAVHMEIRNIGGHLEIVDLGSTYGTFLANGTKLNPMVPYAVQSNSEFYLGASENKFRVL